MKNLQAMLLADFYKISHRKFYPEGTQLIYSTFTPRASLLEGVTEVVSFGQQMFIKEWLIAFFDRKFFDRSKSDIVNEYTRFIKATLGEANPETQHIEDLHDLGYLPLSIKSIPEGTLVPLRVPMMTIENTDPHFFWVTNYIETLLSSELWQTMTSATIAHEYKKLLTGYAKATGGDIGFVDFQAHDFSFRGLGGVSAAMKSGMGHLLSFAGTDTIPAILGMEEYYKADITKELVGTSIPASEHSIESSFPDDLSYFEYAMTKAYPTGMVSIVADGRDFWNVVDTVLPALKDKIMARDGKVTIRPDSGDPVKILCGDLELSGSAGKGLVESLWDIFGGTVNDAGYKVLDSHIGCIYGDSITRARAQQISGQLKQKGFASTNVVYGIGSFTYQYNTRDTFGFAVKSTLTKRNDAEIPIFKDPKTDNGTKKSQKGAVAVFELLNGDDTQGPIKFIDGLTLEEANNYPGNMLVEIFRDGKLLVDESLSTIRARLKANVN